MKTKRRYTLRRTVIQMTAIACCIALAASGEDQELDHFMEIDTDSVAFPEAVAPIEFSSPVTTRKGEWSFTVSQESGRQVLSAASGDTRVTQSITPDAVFKRFAFDTRKQRFEPMRQEIRIEHTSGKKLQEIERLKGVTAVKHYENLGFSIVRINVEVNPVEVFRTLKNDFEGVHARILTGFFDDEPM